jgi:hypothetical protein
MCALPCRPSRHPGIHRLRRCYWSANPVSTGVVEKTRSLASYAVSEVRGGCFVEKQYGVGVTPQHRGWHALGDVVLHGGHGCYLVRTRSEEQDRLRVKDGSHAGRDRMLRRFSQLTLRVFTRRLMGTIRLGLFRCRQRRADVGFDSGGQGSVEASGTSIHPCLESLSVSNSSADPAPDIHSCSKPPSMPL